MFEGETSVQSFAQKLDEKVAMGASVKKVVPRPAEGNMELRLPTVCLGVLASVLGKCVEKLDELKVLTICVLIGEPVCKLVNPEFKVSLHQL